MKALIEKLAAAAEGQGHTEANPRKKILERV